MWGYTLEIGVTQLLFAPLQKSRRNHRMELDQGRGLRAMAKCKSLCKPTWNHYERHNVERIIHFKMSFKDLGEVLFFSYQENMISDEEFLLLYDEYSSKNPEFEPLWFQPENSRFEVRDRNSRTSWHAQWLSCCKNASGWRRWYQERLVLKFPKW